MPHFRELNALEVSWSFDRDGKNPGILYHRITFSALHGVHRRDLLCHSWAQQEAPWQRQWWDPSAGAEQD